MSVIKVPVQSTMGDAASAVSVRWTSGTTWHPLIWTEGEVDCFELSWDEHGKPTPTGKRARMSANACLASQRAPEAASA